MPRAFNKVTWAWLDDTDGMQLTPPEDWIVDPVFDDVNRAQTVGPAYWRFTGGNTIHVMTDAEINTDPILVNAIRERRKDEVNAYRAARLVSGYTDANNIKWGTRPEDITNLNAVCTLIALGIVTDTQVWRDDNNNNHNMTPAQLVQLAGEIASFGRACYQTSWTHKANLDALNTVSDLEAYDITTGWPA